MGFRLQGFDFRASGRGLQGSRLSGKGPLTSDLFARPHNLSRFQALGFQRLLDIWVRLSQFEGEGFGRNIEFEGFGG